MRRSIPAFVLCCSLGAMGCGSGGAGLPGNGPLPPSPSPVPPVLVTFTPGPVTDIPDPVFGSAPFTLVDAELADLDDGIVDLGWIVGTASTTTTHETGSRPGTGNGSFTGDYVLGVGEEGLVYGVQITATFIGVATVGYRISGTTRAGAGGFVPSADVDLLAAGGTVGVCDLDDDGDLDLLLGDAVTLEVHALLNDTL